MSRLRAEGTGDVASAIIQLADMQSILADGMAPANLMAARCMDTDFPTLCGALDMDEIKNESDQFHQDVAAEISASGAPDADALAEAFAEATAETGAPESAPQDEFEIESEPLEGVSVEPVPATVPNGLSPAETAADVAESGLAAAEDLLAQIEAGGDLLAAATDAAGPEDEPVVAAAGGEAETASAASSEATAGAFSEVQDELAAMSEALSTTADELGSLTETVAAAVGAPDMAIDADADLAAAMADMLAPAADMPEPATESVAAPLVEIADSIDIADRVDAADNQAVGSETAVDAALDAMSMTAEPPAAETALEPSIAECELPTSLDQVAEPAPPEEDPLAELLKSAGAGNDDAAQAEAFAALLKEPSAEADAPLAAMLTAAVSDAATTETAPADGMSGDETPAEQPVVAEAPAMTESEVASPQISEPEITSAAPVGEAVPAVAAAAKPVDGLNGDFRAQLDEVKNTLVSQIDRLGGLFENVARVHEESQQTLAKALEVKQATDQAFDASRQYADAFAKAELARAACQQAEAQVSAARMQWETAQQGASAAVQGITPPARTAKRSSAKRGVGG